jgi:hypothetical protein
MMGYPEECSPVARKLAVVEFFDILLDLNGLIGIYV